MFWRWIIIAYGSSTALGLVTTSTFSYFWYIYFSSFILFVYLFISPSFLFYVLVQVSNAVQFNFWNIWRNVYCWFLWWQLVGGNWEMHLKSERFCGFDILIIIYSRGKMELRTVWELLEEKRVFRWSLERVKSEATSRLLAFVLPDLHLSPHNHAQLYTFLETTLDCLALVPSFIRFFGGNKNHSMSPGGFAVIFLASSKFMYSASRRLSYYI